MPHWMCELHTVMCVRYVSTNQDVYAASYSELHTGRVCVSRI